MKKSIPFFLVATAVSLPLLARPSAADVPAFPLLADQLAPEQPRPATIKVKNLMPSEIAWLLDPSHNQAPASVRISNRERKLYFPTALNSAAPGIDGTNGYAPQSPGESTPALPEGIERIVAIDPQNALLVFGTKSGLEALRTRIDSLDKIPRLLEIEVRYVKIGTRDMKALGIEAAPAAMSSGPLRIGTVHGDLNGAITQLVKDRKASVIMAPRVQVQSGRTASLRSSEVTDAAVSIKDGAQFKTMPDLSQGNFKIQQSIGFTVTPQIISEGRIEGNVEVSETNITLELVTGRVFQLLTPGSESPVWKSDLDGIQTIYGVKDGQTFALMGADTSIVTRLIGKTAKPSNLLILVTARLVRREGE